MIRKNFLYFRKRNFSFFTFFRCFIFHSAGIYVFHLCWVFSFFTFLTCFLFHISRVFSFFQLCSGVFVRRVLQMWESSLYSQAFITLHSVPYIWHNLLLSRLPWEPAVLPWRLQGLPLRFKTQTRPVCLFESQCSAKGISQ